MRRECRREPALLAAVERASRAELEPELDFAGQLVDVLAAGTAAAHGLELQIIRRQDPARSNLEHRLLLARYQQRKTAARLPAHESVRVSHAAKRPLPHEPRVPTRAEPDA